MHTSPEILEFAPFFSGVDDYTQLFLSGGHVAVRIEGAVFAVIDHDSRTLTRHGLKAASPSNRLGAFPTEGLKGYIVRAIPHIFGQPRFLPFVSRGGNEICLLDPAFLKYALGQEILPPPEPPPEPPPPAPAPEPVASASAVFAGAAVATNASALPSSLTTSDVFPEFTSENLLAAIGGALGRSGGQLRITFSMDGKQYRGLVEPRPRSFPGLDSFTKNTINFSRFAHFMPALAENVQSLISGHCLEIKNNPERVGWNNLVVIILDADMHRAQTRPQIYPLDPRGGANGNRPSNEGSPPGSPSIAVQAAAEQPKPIHFNSEYMLAQELVSLSEKREGGSFYFTLNGSSFVAVSTHSAFSEDPDIISATYSYSRPFRVHPLSELLEKKMKSIGERKGIRFCVSDEKRETNVFIIADNPPDLIQLLLAIELVKPSSAHGPKKRLVDSSFRVRKAGLT